MPRMMSRTFCVAVAEMTTLGPMATARDRKRPRGARAVDGGRYFCPKTSFKRSVTRAVGLVRIFFSSSPRTWKSPSSALVTT